MNDWIDNYKPSSLENAIIFFYRKHHISNPEDIDLDWMANETGIWVYYKPHRSTSFQLRGMWSVIIDDRLPEPQQRVELAHELGHIFLHCGRQEFLTSDFRALQEWQADRFSMYALAPTFMIANALVDGVCNYSRERIINYLADIFNVTTMFMDARLSLLEERLRTLAAEKHMEEMIRETRSSYDYAVRHPMNHRIEYLIRDGRVIGRRRRADI